MAKEAGQGTDTREWGEPCVLLVPSSLGFGWNAGSAAELFDRVKEEGPVVMRSEHWTVDRTRLFKQRILEKPTASSLAAFYPVLYTKHSRERAEVLVVGL